MIPRAYITAWRSEAPWPLDSQVEQDLVLSRALADIFSHPGLMNELAFRGGTALHKLHFDTPGRYSEDLDFVQVKPGPIGPLLDDLRSVLDPWLGEPARRRNVDSVKLLYRFETTSLPIERMRVKIEINTREHFSIHGLTHRSYHVRSPWYDGKGNITLFKLEELLATKLRALYQRKKGRDLYDLWFALSSLKVDEEAVTTCLEEYLEHSHLQVSRKEFEENLLDKLNSNAFKVDVEPLLRDGIVYDVDAAAVLVQKKLLSRLPGNADKS